MIVDKLTSLLTKWLVNDRIITDDDLDIYKYGFRLLFTKVLHVATILFLGLLLNIILETIFFVFLFQWLRKYSGGWHAENDKACFVMSCLLEIILFLCLEGYTYHPMANLIIVFSSVLVIPRFAPGVSKNNPLTFEEKAKNRTRSIYICFFYYCMLILLVTMGATNLAITILYVLFITSILLVKKNNN